MDLVHPSGYFETLFIPFVFLNFEVGTFMTLVDGLSEVLSIQGHTKQL